MFYQEEPPLCKPTRSIFVFTLLLKVLSVSHRSLTEFIPLFLPTSADPSRCSHCLTASRQVGFYFSIFQQFFPQDVEPAEASVWLKPFSQRWDVVYKRASRLLIAIKIWISIVNIFLFFCMFKILLFCIWKHFFFYVHLSVKQFLPLCFLRLRKMYLNLSSIARFKTLFTLRQDTWCSETWASRLTATSPLRFVTIPLPWGWSSTRGRSSTSTTFAPSRGNTWVRAAQGFLLCCFLVFNSR